MKIGILGTGDVGRALGNGFVGLGWETKMGSREANNEKAAAWSKQAGARASHGTFADAAAFGDVVVLATVWTAVKQVLDACGGKLDGKIVIDATNPLDFSTGAPRLALGTTDSGGEQVQRWLPKSRVVKAFNSVGNAHMVNPDFPGGPPSMWIAGNDADAKKIVTDILTKFGWDTIDTGGIEGARLLEPLCILWVDYAMRHKGWNHAFKLLRK